MTLLRKEDTAKAGKLIGLIVAVFGCAAWRVVGAVSPAKPAAPPPETIGAPAATSPTNGEPTPPVPAKPDDSLIEPSRPVLGSMVDPFRTIVPVYVPPAAKWKRPSPLPSGPLPPAEPLPGAVGGAPLPAAAPVAVVEAPMKVTGILSGANATAVVETGKETCVVREGGHLPDGSEVVAISPTTVTLRHDGKTRVLDVGN